MFIFDLDGTLIDSNGIWADVDRTFLARRGMEYTKEYYEGVAHTIFPLAAVFTKEYCHLSESCEEIMAEWMELAKGNYANVPIKPMVKEVLETLRSRGERMVIFTSCVPEHCRTALAVHGLEQYFERVIFAQELGGDKSNPEIFRTVASMLGVKPQECTLVDDSVKSCRSAKEAGMYVIGVYDDFFDSTRMQMRSVCDKFIESFEEFL
ncbi:MAG: HAD-IA family hydrolase [Oscillospiraceae bacterium]|nr:HAD-IA family hydrolase [Oscillospiraceae bacterium]